MAELRPYMNIGPGDFIKEELESRNWTNEDLSKVLGLSPKTISELLNNKQRITIDTAKLLGKAFGQSPQYWLNLDNSYRLRRYENDSDSEVEIKSKIYERMPINDMIKKGWINNYKDTKDLCRIYMDFWNINRCEFDWLDKLVVPCTRKSEAYSKFNKYFLLTWTQMAKSTSEKIKAKKFYRKDLQNLTTKLTDYSVQNNGIGNFLNDLSDTGVKFLCLEHLTKTYLDGASFMHKGSPVIVYTKRYDRLDNFWFTMAHEIGHVLLHIKKEGDAFADDLKIKDSSGYEKEANEFASKSLKTKYILDFFSGYKHYTSEYRIRQASNELKINKAIIIGILKYYDFLSYNRLNRLNEAVGDKIPRKYLTVDK